MNSIPTPKLKDLCFAYFGQASLRRWKEDCLKDYSQVAWVRGGAHALALAIKSLQSQKNAKTVMYLPAYFCGDSLRFLRSMNIKFVFYELNSDFTPNFEFIRPPEKIDTVSVFLFVHFFGKYLNTHEANNFCQQHGMALIEDCAHLTKPQSDRHVGDFLVFSPHKHFGTKFGGILLSRHREFRETQSCTINKSDLPWYFCKSLQSNIRALMQSSNTVPAVRLSNIFEQFDLELLDGFHLKLNQFFLDKADATVAIRQSNAQHLETFFRDVASCDALTNFVEMDQPYIFGVKFENRQQREFTQKLLIKNKIPCMLWPDIPFELLEIEELFSSVQQQVEKSLFLFCHQQLDIGSYTENLTFALKDGKAFGMDT